MEWSISRSGGPSRCSGPQIGAYRPLRLRDQMQSYNQYYIITKAVTMRLSMSLIENPEASYLMYKSIHNMSSSRG